MRDYTLNIAGYNIRFESYGPDIVPSKRFLSSLSTQQSSLETGKLIIRVHSGAGEMPPEARRVFHAPFIEEVNGVQLRSNPEFWSIWKNSSFLFIKVVFPLLSGEKTALVKFSVNSSQWDLWIDSSNDPVDPFEYPLDGLLLYYLTVIHGDIMIHASGVNHDGKGYLFSGISGKGKTTISGLWNDYGSEVIHDDRLIIRNTMDGYTMYNTPVYDDDIPRRAHLDKIFLIEHGNENRITVVKGADSVSKVMANAIQHNWGPDIVAKLLGSVSDICGKVPVCHLYFIPDRSVINYILDNE
jgi:hypothetical protein